MLVSGLWHGAGLNFIAWGAVHAVAIVIEKVAGITRWLGPAGMQHKWWPASLFVTLLWYLVVQLTWVFSMAFFRSVDIETAWQVLGNAVQGLFLIKEHGVEFAKSNGVITAAWWFTFPVVALHLRTFVAEQFRVRSSVYERSIYAGAMIYAVVSLYAPDQRFIYFQF
jgi:D-alanyl-lipoteichoic acid acyltransferase DltB (MBOAT superfamily)